MSDTITLDEENDRAFDSEGIEIFHGDIIECEVEGGDEPWRWHAAFRRYQGQLEIRDLNANNIYMTFVGKTHNRGPFWKHLDILDDDDLGYYFGMDRKLAEQIAELQKKADRLDELTASGITVIG